MGDRKVTIMRAIDWRDDAVVIIDQTLLPERTTRVVVREPAQLVTEIRRLAIRGAMALGVAGGPWA
nr:hypothetical protein GCM10020092_053360 [Actinoplanes digitatis]